MRRQVVWTDTARADYLNILRHITAEDPDAADRMAMRIEDAAVKLGDFATGRPGRVTGTYEIAAQPEGGELVAILHVIHGARNWPAERWPED